MTRMLKRVRNNADDIAAELIIALRTATTGSPELDLLVGIALGEIPADAEMERCSFETEWIAWANVDGARCRAQTETGRIAPYSRSWDAVVAAISARGLGAKLYVGAGNKRRFPGKAYLFTLGAGEPQWAALRGAATTPIAACLALLEFLFEYPETTNA